MSLPAFSQGIHRQQGTEEGGSSTACYQLPDEIALFILPM